MPLTDSENQNYQTILKHAQELSLNLMAIKVENRPEDFLSWCEEFYRLCSQELNLELLEPTQFTPLKKMQDTLTNAISAAQIKMLRVAPWPVFVSYIKDKADLHALDERLKLVAHCKALQTQSLSEMIDEDLTALIGKHTAKHDTSIYDFDCEWFGSAKTSKVFIQLWQAQPSQFETAINCIPLEGEVSHADYTNFVSAYQAIFAENDLGAAPLIPATRLLAMRRPDQFVALTNAKIDLFSQGLSVAKFNNKDFDGYWRDLILTIRSFAWYKQALPADEFEQSIADAKAILIDVFLFADEQTAKNSNYLKLKNKPSKSSTTSGKRSRRSRESVQVLVDKALAADDMPQYLLDKRDSIVAEVQNGKSIDQVISLLRSIFG